MHKKTVAIVIGLVMVVAGVGAAYAYWSAGGDGVGTATTGTNAELVVNQTSTVADMGPGIAAQDLEGDFDNGNDGPTYVGTVTASITSVTGGDGACAAADYTLSNPIMAVDDEVPNGDAQGDWGGATIAFNNSATVNQDGCKNATVNLAYTIGTTPPTP
jgi:hypothetical protein